MKTIDFCGREWGRKKHTRICNSLWSIVSRWSPISPALVNSYGDTYAGPSLLDRLLPRRSTSLLISRIINWLMIDLQWMIWSFSLISIDNLIKNVKNRVERACVFRFHTHSYDFCVFRGVLIAEKQKMFIEEWQNVWSPSDLSLSDEHQPTTYFRQLIFLSFQLNISLKIIQTHHQLHPNWIYQILHRCR